MLPDGPLHTCPWNLVRLDPRLFLWIKAHRHYKNRFLWFDGGIGDQPAIMIDAIEVIEDEIGMIREERRQEEERKRRQESNKGKSRAGGGITKAARRSRR